MDQWTSIYLRNIETVWITYMDLVGSVCFCPSTPRNAQGCIPMSSMAKAVEVMKTTPVDHRLQFLGNNVMDSC